MSIIRKKFIGSVGLVVICLSMSLFFATAAFATSHSFGYTLPEYQENVTVVQGQRQSYDIYAEVSVYSVSRDDYAWLWCDASSAGNRLTDSAMVRQGGFYTLSYYSQGTGDVLLRGCTNGWTSPTYISGYVTF